MALELNDTVLHNFFLREKKSILHERQRIFGLMEQRYQPFVCFGIRFSTMIIVVTNKLKCKCSKN